jgi:hypothetical protein
MSSSPIPHSEDSGAVRKGASSALADGPARFAPDGSERPGFVLEFPPDPELDALVKAFERGDFASVRAGAPKLAATTQSPAVRAAALELKQRISPDPMVVWFLGASIGLLIFLVTWSYWHH